MDKPVEPEEIKPRPDYPPKTPPPPKKPPSPPPPDPPRSDLLPGLPVPQRAGRAGHPVMKNRRGTSWMLESAAWTPAKAARQVTAQLADWGFTAPGTLEAVVQLLTGSVVADGGRRVSIHLSEQDRMALVLCLSHQQAQAPETPEVLTALRDLGTASCGTEMTAEGRQVWALVPLQAATAAQSGTRASAVSD
ncbi:hypothetical protein ACIREE_38770 [Streptomyces sp. NPDC102467]|uniref:hypothetical protein n=1 Tax=Streptomyces sp. NPDC102467 TaxID=3366179 RepID=UPI003823B516